MSKANINVRVHIIVPVYNAKHTLRKCVNSLKNQTLKDIRIILIDDGSTDGSGELCDEFAKNDKRILVIHKENGGSDSARFAGIEAVQGEGYTTFCDADDYMPNDGVEKLYALAVEKNADIVSGTLKRFFKNKFFVKQNIPNSLKEYRVFDHDELMQEICPSYFGITDFPGYLHTKLYANKLLKQSTEFQRPVKFFQEDIAFNLQMLFLTNSLAVMPDIVYYYRTGGATSRFMPLFLDDCIALYEFKNEMINIHNLPERLRYTTAVELKNELWTWFEMYYRYEGKTKGELKIKKEIERACNLHAIVEAVNYPKDDTSGIVGFRESVRKKDIEKIYKLLHDRAKKQRFKQVVKKILFG